MFVFLVYLLCEIVVEIRRYSVCNATINAHKTRVIFAYECKFV